MITHVLFFHFLFGFTIACISALMTYLLVHRLKIFDVPNERSSHTRTTVRGGGIAIVAAFLIGISMIHLLGDKSPISKVYFLGFLGASFVISTLSFYDDFKHVSFKMKLVGQFTAIVIAMISGIVIDSSYLPIIGEIHWGVFSSILTFLWIFGLTNAYNFIDGLDGLAISTALIAALFLSYISFEQGSYFIYLASLTLATASIGFLIFNWPPARIFMGDVGSTFLGFTFAVMAVIAARYDHSHTSLFVVPLLLFHVIFDTTFTFFRRLFAGDKVFFAHRSHLYQLLNRSGYSHQLVTVLYSVMAFCQGVAAILMVRYMSEYKFVVYFPFIIAYSIYVVWVMYRVKKAGVVL